MNTDRNPTSEWIAGYSVLIVLAVVGYAIYRTARYILFPCLLLAAGCTEFRASVQHKTLLHEVSFKLEVER